MGSVFNRGTREKPNWYVKYRDADGRWKMVPSHQPTKPLARKHVEDIEARIANGQPGLIRREETPTCAVLMHKWVDSLTNRNAADDRSRLERHLLPTFGERRLPIALPAIMEWIDAQRAAGRLSEASIRHNLNLLSRFFSWAVERGHTDTNPVRQIPVGKRPQQSVKSDVPWLDDDATTRMLISELRKPINMMFYLGNRSGLRLGEAVGLRMADLGFLAEGVIRVRFSYDGPLKEDKDGVGKVKWVPAPDDAAAFLAPWLSMRKTQGAGPEEFVFPVERGRRTGKWYRKEFVEQVWEDTTQERGIRLTWYQATRHSFVSRNLAAGASLDEVSAAVGHSSPGVTKRYYDHFIRKTFSPGLRAGLGFGSPGDTP